MSRIAGFTVLTVVLLGTIAGAIAAPQKRSSGAGMLPQDGSLVGLHELRREGNMVCMVGHTHIGASTNQPTKKAAEVVAMRDWSSFTGWEYGNHWGNPMYAANKTMTCSGNNGRHNCDFEARPCRR